MTATEGEISMSNHLSISTEERPLAAVTGASSGIGYELAKQFVDHGYDLIICAEDSALIDKAAELAVNGASVTPVRADLVTGSGVEQLAAAINESGRPLAAIAINAGVGNSGPFAESSLDADLDLIALNVTSTVHLTKLVLPAMVERGAGRILFTASVASLMPGPYYATYAASKAFVLSFAEAVRYEVKDAGVTVTALMPGPTDTHFFDRAGMQGTPAGEGPKDDPAEVARDGFEALMAGKDHVVGGSTKNKAQATASKLMTDPMKAALHARMTKPAGE
jgi:short-subunit dehydrogenase